MLRAWLFAALGFVAGALLVGLLVTWLSPNTHDRSVEAAMTAFVVGGPAGAIAGLVLAWLGRRRR